MTSEEDWEALWEATETHFAAPVDVLVNNAGIAPVPPKHDWRKTMAINIVNIKAAAMKLQKKVSPL